MSSRKHPPGRRDRAGRSPISGWRGRGRRGLTRWSDRGGARNTCRPNRRAANRLTTEATSLAWERALPMCVGTPVSRETAYGFYDGRSRSRTIRELNSQYGLARRGGRETHRKAPSGRFQSASELSRFWKGASASATAETIPLPRPFCTRRCGPGQHISGLLVAGAVRWFLSRKLGRLVGRAGCFFAPVDTSGSAPPWVLGQYSPVPAAAEDAATPIEAIGKGTRRVELDLRQHSSPGSAIRR